MVYSCHSKTHWWEFFSAWVDGLRPYSIQMERILFHRACSFNFTSILTSGSRQTIFFTPLNPLGDNPDEEEPRDVQSKPRKVHYHSEWKILRTPSTGSIEPEHRTKYYDSGRQGLMPILCWQIASTEYFFEKGWRNFIRETLDVPNRRLYSRVLCNRSSSNSNSNKTQLRVRLLAPGNWCRECREFKESRVTQKTTQIYTAQGIWSVELSYLLRESLNSKSTSELKDLHKM